MKRLALSLNLPDDIKIPGYPPKSLRTQHRVASAKDHYHILHCGLPRLLAACPTMRLHLRVTGGSPFLPCSVNPALQQQVNASSNRACL